MLLQPNHKPQIWKGTSWCRCVMEYNLLPSCIEAFTSRMWCSPCAPLCSSLCSVQRDTPQFAYPVPSRCLLRARRLQHSDSVSPSSPHATSFSFLDEGRTVLPVLRWRSSAGRVPVIVCSGRTFICFWSLFSSRLIFNKMWDARSLRGARGVLSSAVAA